MTTTLALLALLVVLACPAHMLWRMRRGQAAGCLPAPDGAEDVRARQVQLAEQVARVRAERG